MVDPGLSPVYTERRVIILFRWKQIDSEVASRSRCICVLLREVSCANLGGSGNLDGGRLCVLFRVVVFGHVVDASSTKRAAANAAHNATNVAADEEKKVLTKAEKEKGAGVRQYRDREHACNRV